ncbi:S-layer homology domain-containing protein [Candidatus Villigracilis affinis]|uniref:S-layer homology domain-containing protein n=1 Tax=Candidatus Villigracilis affinis TaxID=3140682 RepID=UPI002A1BA270|nr:S-layer homology domain-containing protein [Anaerolineales bacterium]
MNKKIFTILLLSVFMLAQFGMASAVAVTGDASITGLPDFSTTASVDVEWAASGMAAGTKNILLWAREYADPANAYMVGDCQLVATINGTSDASGTFTYDYTLSTLALIDGDSVEFTVTVDDSLCAAAAIPAIDSVMGTTYIDAFAPVYVQGYPPSQSLLMPDSYTYACNTFEFWAVATDGAGFTPVYSGFHAWNTFITGTFAPPAPIGPGDALLSWEYTFPSTASGVWTFGVEPEDKSGNIDKKDYFRDAVAIAPEELEECANFTDISGHADETYVRYLATLGLISGFADGSFGPDTTLTRAEAATLLETSNGYDETMLPASAPAGCEFTDVTASDWFAGWVWQACSDGIMNGVGGGLFDPNNLLTRGQIVTIFNNVSETFFVNPLLFGGYINTFNPVTFLYSLPFTYRQSAWTDVSIGAYYAEPVVKAYGWGIAEGTSETTFSPDQPATRGEFAKMLYRAISRID